MSTIVYQGLQSYFEPQPTETTTLRLKLAAPESIELDNKITKNPDLGGWTFLQSLSNSTQSLEKPSNTESFYPSIKLSQKSLELCTENLGSETGSDDTSATNIFSLTSIETSSAKSSITTRTRTRGSAKKANTRSFPPPLTTISGSNSLQVRPHREGGRLIIEAVEAPSTRPCFEVERSHGRLQLKFLKNCDFFPKHKMRSEDNQDDNIGESETKDNDTNKTEDVNQDDEFGNNNIVDKEKNDGYMKEDMDGNRKEIEVEMGREKFQRHNSRCKESEHANNNKGLCNWEAFWVAT